VKSLDMKTIVTGAAGMLGSDLCPLLLKNNFDIYPTDLYSDNKNNEVLDVGKRDQVIDYVKKINPDMIIHLAAETDVDKCEKMPDRAFLVNTLGTENIALACKELDIPMVFISTGAVFDGKKNGPYIETDIPHPVNVYGKTKLEAENVVKKILSKYFIFRAGWMIGGGGKDKKFVGKIINILKEKKQLSVVIDKKGCPTFTDDMSFNMLQVIKTDNYGLFHMVNKGATTRFDIALKIVEYLDRKDVTVKPVTSESFPLLARRPDSEALKNRNLERLGLNFMPKWEDSLKRYIAKLKAQL